MIRGIVLYFLFLTMHAAAQGQSVQVRGTFRADSLSIGEEVSYILTAKYPAENQILFPDTTYSFSPFEIRSKRVFTTETTDGVSRDSSVYLLTTFEIDSVQRLRLPVFVVQGKDCVAVFSRSDSILLRFHVKQVPDSVSAQQLPLKTNTLYQHVRWILNYPLLMIIAGVVLILALVIWIIFGKRIKKYFALKRLNREYEIFLARFGNILRSLEDEFSSNRAEEALVAWKKYMEDLEKSPYTKYTSREIHRKLANAELDNALHTIDRGIYGGFASALEPFEFLQRYSYHRYKKKEDEVRNG